MARCGSIVVKLDNCQMRGLARSNVFLFETLRVQVVGLLLRRACAGRCERRIGARGDYLREVSCTSISLRSLHTASLNRTDFGCGVRQAARDLGLRSMVGEGQSAPVQRRRLARRRLADQTDQRIARHGKLSVEKKRGLGRRVRVAQEGRNARSVSSIAKTYR